MASSATSDSPVNSKSTLIEKLDEERKKLPLYFYRDQLLEAIEKYQVLVIVGEPGCGKTTEIPQYLHEAGYTQGGKKKIGITLPCGLAHVMPDVAARVAGEMGVQLGHEVGYINPNNLGHTSSDVLIKYMTDGILVRQIFERENLESYSVVMVDEAQERTLSTDILLGILKNIIRLRPSNFKLLISCSTVTDAEKFCDFFDTDRIFQIPRRRGNNQMHYMKTMDDGLVDLVVTQTLALHVTEPPGDMLVFLPRQQEIETVDHMLKQIMIARGHSQLITCLNSAEVLEPTPQGVRKVVLATSPAEISWLTLTNIQYVIDSGLCKMKSYDPMAGEELELVSPVSKAEATQRAKLPGSKCYRLYTNNFYEGLQEKTTPEVQRRNLVNVVLVLKRLGFADVFKFGFVDPPAPEALAQALQQLIGVGVLDNNLDELTQVGKQMADTVSLSM